MANNIYASQLRLERLNRSRYILRIAFMLTIRSRTQARTLSQSRREREKKHGFYSIVDGILSWKLTYSPLVGFIMLRDYNHLVFFYGKSHYGIYKPGETKLNKDVEFFLLLRSLRHLSSIIHSSIIFVSL